MRLLAVFLTLLGACGGGRYQGGVYEDDEARYRLRSPGSGWESVHVEDAVDLAWSNAQLAAVISANARCNPSLDIPLGALTNHLLVGFTERELDSQELTDVAGREALRTHLRAKLDGVARELLLTVLKKDGCVYDFHLVARPGDSFEQARNDYEALVTSFETR